MWSDHSMQALLGLLAAALLLAAAVLLVHRGPRDALGGLRRAPLLLRAVLDVRGLALLLAGVRRLVATRHESAPLRRVSAAWRWQVHRACHPAPHAPSPRRR